MSRPVVFTPEVAKERRKASIRESVARHKDRLRSMTRLEQAAYKARESLGEDYVPYTPEEAEAVASLRAKMAELEAEAERLHARLLKRLSQEAAEDARLAPLATELEAGTIVRLEIKPF